MDHVTAAAPGGAGASAGTPLDITFESRGDRLIGLGLVNGLLKVVTLGIYSFWAKTEVRKRLWSFTKLNGEPLSYTGTGKELFLGFLVVFFLFVLPLSLGGLAILFLFPGVPAALVTYQLSAYGLFFFLLGNAIYRAQRYRLSRTEWRGIRGSLEGSPWRYGWTYFWTLALPALLTVVAAGLLIDPEAFGLVRALGASAAVPALYASRWSIAALFLGGVVIALIMPWRANALQRQMTNEMHFGNVPLTYHGGPAPLYKRYLLAGLGGVVLLGLALAATGFIAAPIVPQDGVTGEEFAPALTGAKVVAIWVTYFILLAVITAWYRASQMNHFARSTKLGTAQFRATATGPGLVWLALSNWLLVMLATILGIAAGAGLFYVSGIGLPTPPQPGAPAEPAVALNLFILLPIILTTTIAATFAQFRAARYFLSRLKLDGTVDLAAIQQSASSGPKRGEGLAQVFDLDAF